MPPPHPLSSFSRGSLPGLHRRSTIARKSSGGEPPDFGTPDGFNRDETTTTTALEPTQIPTNNDMPRPRASAQASTELRRTTDSEITEHGTRPKSARATVPHLGRGRPRDASRIRLRGCRAKEGRGVRMSSTRTEHQPIRSPWVGYQLGRRGAL